MNCSLTENNLGRLERGLGNEGNNEDPREVLQEMQKREWSESAPTERDSEEGEYHGLRDLPWEES